MQPIEILDVLLLYHLMEASHGSASRTDVQLHADGTLETPMMAVAWASIGSWGGALTSTWCSGRWTC